MKTYLNDQQITELSTQISEALLTVYVHREENIVCDRMVCMKGKYPMDEKDMGGRNKSSMIQTVRKVLEEHFMDDYDTVSTDCDGDCNPERTL